GQIVSVILTSQIGAVAPGSGTPTGTVRYLVTGRSRPFATLSLKQGTAVLTLKAAQALNKTFSIRYSGDSIFNPSTSPKLVVTKRGLSTLARPFTAFFSRVRQPSQPAVRSLNVLSRVSGSSVRRHGTGH